MAAAKAARRNTFMHELHLPNDPFQDPRIGRRTGVPLNIKARKDSHGFDNIDDYFPDSDPEEENVVPNTQGTDENLPVGRKTVNISLQKESKELENVDDDDDGPDSGEVESADTHEKLEESPNVTGTAIKNPASREPTPQLKGPIKKRLSFASGKSPNESEDKQVQSRNSPRDKNTEPVSVETVESDTEIDVVDVTSESQLIIQETSTHSPAAKTTEKAKKQRQAHTRNTENHIEEDDEVIDVEEIEEEETFLTIGNNTMRNVKSSPVVGKSPLSSQAESFVMSESFVLEGTKHKTMSPEFGSGSDSQTEPDPRAKKSKIPVRQKSLANSKPPQRRATRGRQKKVVEESEAVDAQVVQDGQKEDHEERDESNTKQDNMKSTRGRKQKADKVKPDEAEVVEAQNRGAETKQRRAKSLPGKQQRQQKSTRRGEVKEGSSMVVTSDEEDDDDEGNTGDIAHEGNTVDIAHEEKRGRGRRNKSAPNTTQQLKKVPKGRKQKSDTENVEGEGVEQNEDSDNKKPSGRRTRTRKRAEGSRKGEQSEGVADGSKQADKGNPTELSGRKTRAQRKKDEDAKLNKGDGKERDIDGGRKDREVVSADLEIEDVESENIESVDTEKEAEKSVQDDKVSKVQRNEKAKKDVEDQLGNEADLAQAKTKRGGRKSQSVMREKTVEEPEGQDLAEEVEIEAKVRGERRGRGRGRSSQLKEATQGAEQEEKSNDLETVDELTYKQNDTVAESTGGQTFSNEHEKTANDASVSNISNVSSNASSGSESTSKVGNGAGRKRRKRSRILPPYAFKRRASNAISSENSTAINSHDSVNESVSRVGTKKRKLHDEGNETNIPEKSSKKGASTNRRTSGRAKRTGKTSEGGTKTVGKGNETECSQDNNDDSVVDEVGVNDSVQGTNGVGDSSFDEDSHSTGTVAPAQPVTALRSILKSGGSVGRASTVSRKRVKASDKSHSGGSDADDESMLPTKQPNRKRLSTVSFASTPFVQQSPSASANRSSAGLSFVSKDSSFRSTDGTFTPGSTRTVRSSVGSGGGSGNGESDIDPEEEVTLTNDPRQSEDTSDEQSTRRSKRTIVPPLQYWKNERIDYERRKSGGWCIKGIIKNPTPTPKYKKKPRKTKKPVVRKESNENVAYSSEEELDNQDLEGYQEITNPTGLVLNPEINEEVEMDIFHTRDMLNFTNPSGKPAQDDDPLIVHKFMSHPLFGGGQVVLRPGAEKGRQFVRNDTMVFNVIKGSVLVTVHQSSAVLHSGSTFFVPQGNSYNIKNLRKMEANLTFVQIKG